ncbi:MAG: hypothetical protein ABIF82_00320 [Planctomycetota bacterium]
MVHFAESPVDRSPVKLCHQNIPFPQADVTKDALVGALRFCGDCMLNHTSDDGLLTYLYNVSDDDKDDYDDAGRMTKCAREDGNAVYYGYDDAVRVGAERPLALDESPEWHSSDRTESGPPNYEMLNERFSTKQGHVDFGGKMRKSGGFLAGGVDRGRKVAYTNW